MAQLHTIMVLQRFVVLGGLAVSPRMETQLATPAPTPPPCIRAAWNLCDNIMQVHSNLAGIGPNKTGREEFRIPKIGTVKGITLDLVVTVPDGKYESFRVRNKKNGGGMYVSMTEDQPYVKANKKTDLWGKGNFPCWIVFPWETGTSAKLHWRFVREGKSDPSDTVIVEHFRMLMGDFDYQNAGNMEFVEFNTPPQSVWYGENIYKRSETMFESTEQGNIRNNPTKTLKEGCEPTAEDPYQCMTEGQINRAVEAEYLDRGEWDMTLTAVGGQVDRALQIYGEICTPPPTPTPPPCSQQVAWDLCGNIMQVHSNLAGIGPNKTGLEEFRIPKIATVDGTTLDLVVTVPDGQYQSFRVRNEKNGGGMYVSKTEDQPVIQEVTMNWGEGNSPCWIVMPWETGTSTKLHWRFVREGTSDPVTVERFSMRIADFDHQNVGDMEIVEFNTPPETTTHGVKVNQKTTTRFESTEPGTIWNNPTKMLRADCEPTAGHPYSCMTEEQKDRSVTAQFVKRGEWDMTLTALGGQTDRALQIYGEICSNPPCCSPLISSPSIKA